MLKKLAGQVKTKANPEGIYSFQEAVAILKKAGFSGKDVITPEMLENPNCYTK